ncbi:MAPEG family protein [Paraglaciecola aquimarina]|uniref:MAPEG family protein n=1 Tax=Paraglaciecola aquimarina TaxID=1235557 RepID=A0ABU3SVU1_9ALTE|nr:MAPEG family protein [Paraglaciecola aquimarina]MDU0354098.1 MAPEG family protein [Paraglaciecola aquimarina]
MNATILALMGYIGLILVLLIVMVSYRTSLIQKKVKLPNSFSTDAAGEPAFGLRINRTHANAIEGFSFIGGLMLLALATDSTAITDGLAFWMLGARLGQSVTHLASTSVMAVQIRFVFFLLQVAIAIYWLSMFAVKFI